MGELLLLLLLVAAAALAVAWPLLGPRPDATGEPVDAEREALLVRHRLALEALRDVEADRRAGSLDDEAYRRMWAEAEVHAAATRSALESGAPAPGQPRHAAGGGGRLALAMAGGLVALLLVGFALPAPFGIGERTETNQALADAIAREERRQAEIARLLAGLDRDRTDADAISRLADAYLAGSRHEDRQRGALWLQVLLSLEPENESAYRRLITAYINAGDSENATAALDAYEGIAAPENLDLPFFRGLVALRGEGDRSAAVRHFDRFLELAPDDERATMVRGLRDEAAAED